MEERSALRGAEPMGYVADIFRQNWQESLPTAPRAVFLTGILSSRSDREKEVVLRAVHERLKPGGLVLWTDLFLPGSLELFEAFQLMEAGTMSCPPDAAFRRISELHRSLYPSPALLDRALEMLNRCGFCNTAVVWKRFGYTLLAAEK